MIAGIGIDLATIADFDSDGDKVRQAFITHTFTQAESAYADQSGRPAESFAGMFAVKEAVTKAVCNLAPDDWIDLRRIEVLHDENGAPYVAMTEPLLPYLQKVGVSRVLVSITNEGPYAAAVAVAERDG